MLIGFFLDLEQKRHLMNYRLGENLTFIILGILAVNATFLGMGEPWKV